ncbi:hypothetical protein HPP92_028561 [Vanilla planifolia]|uniref:Uncharacterized protein n=1 Tax=Vanilla planifolia TaxID=51239 RepID=A0A835U2E7_VANPL|nr:hypothetical protein HPP92_028561 [Vanilla planifolia]KAG0446994.1 hypothetical protein HPP92_028566 [Vanilla planifolia]
MTSFPAELLSIEDCGEHPRGTDATKGKAGPYFGPPAAVGIHRYALVLFQRRRLSVGAPPASRARWHTSLPDTTSSVSVAAAYFNSQRAGRPSPLSLSEEDGPAFTKSFGM